MGNLSADFVFSQSSLQDFVDCPRRFELRYLQQLRYPAPEVDDLLEFEQKMAQGERFHKLVHQHIVGIPSSVLSKRILEPELKAYFEAYLQNGLEQVPAKRYPELSLSVPLGDYSLMAKFDLLAFGEKILIIDWKTATNLPRREILEKRLQTIVYPYVLLKGGASLNAGKAIQPEQIQMRYWYTAQGGQSLVFDYSQAQFRQDEAYLLRLVQEINTLAAFPLTTDIRRCHFCNYRSLCDRGISAGSLAEFEDNDYTTSEPEDFNIDIEQIAEIEF